MVIVFILNSKWDSLILEFKHNIYQNQVYLFFFLNSFFFLERHKIIQYCLKPSPQIVFWKLRRHSVRGWVVPKYMNEKLSFLISKYKRVLYNLLSLLLFFVSFYLNRKLKNPYRPIQTLIWNKFMTLIKTPWKPTWKKWNGRTDVSRTTNNTPC